MPSLDIVSEINHHELSNAIDQANREIKQRFDLKDTQAAIEHDKNTITIVADDGFGIQQLTKLLKEKLVKRQIDLGTLNEQSEDNGLSKAQKVFELKEGIDTPNSKKISKMIKDSKLKVQSSYMDNKVRITGKKRDDLQAVMSMLKEAQLDMPLQFNNFRD